MAVIVANLALAVISALKYTGRLLKHDGKGSVVEHGQYNTGSQWSC